MASSPFAPPALAPDYLPGTKFRALIYGASSVFDPWASLFDEVPWGRRSLGFYRDRFRLAHTAREAFKELEEQAQPRLFDPEALGER